MRPGAVYPLLQYPRTLCFSVSEDTYDYVVTRARRERLPKGTIVRMIFEDALSALDRAEERARKAEQVKAHGSPRL